jgi:predicted outer membrane protein
MNMKSKLVNVAILAGLGLTMMHLQAGEGQTNDAVQNNDTTTSADGTDHKDMYRDPIDAEEFVETASAKGIAEIETARMALEEGTSNVHEFANRMIQDHTKANSELKYIARQADLEVADDPMLMDRAKAMMLSVREGQSFDEAYIENQINAHEETIKLFERASHSDNAEIRAYAREKLPKLREHLQMAKELHD